MFDVHQDFFLIHVDGSSQDCTNRGFSRSVSPCGYICAVDVAQNRPQAEVNFGKYPSNLVRSSEIQTETPVRQGFCPPPTEPDRATHSKPVKQSLSVTNSRYLFLPPAEVQY